MGWRLWYLPVVSVLIYEFHTCALGAPVLDLECPDYSDYSMERHGPVSAGRLQLPMQRPFERCRTFISQEVEDVLSRTEIPDPDLARLFENTYPNTLDTAVRWKGFAQLKYGGSDLGTEDLAFIITGDINAMWLRDSANQVLSYLPLLRRSSSPNSLASLFRGVINYSARCIRTNVYCHAFQPPLESGIPKQFNAAFHHNHLKEIYNQTLTFDCKWELDSLASFLQLSTAYYGATGDLSPFSDFKWIETIQIILDAVDGMRRGTYTTDGHVDDSPYTFEGFTNRATETHSNNGLGNPTKHGSGLVRSFFRPSDDATIFHLLIPSNMMFAHFLTTSAAIMERISSVTFDTKQLGARMRKTGQEIDAGVAEHGIVDHPKYGKIYAYEVDGYGSANLMDDANLPGLLSLPLVSNLTIYDPIYQNTRRFVLSEDNPYWMFGPVISAVGGPHIGPGKAWPLASIVRILTSDDEKEIHDELTHLLQTTDGLGLIHESIDSWNQSQWSRQWFSWANGMFGQMILSLDSCGPGLTLQNFQ